MRWETIQKIVNLRVGQTVRPYGSHERYTVESVDKDKHTATFVRRVQADNPDKWTVLTESET